NVTIGGTGPADRNVISGSSNAGVTLGSSSQVGSRVLGSYVGLSSDGTAAVGNGSSGILISSSHNTIGGEQVGAGNVISGNGGEGVTIIPGLSTPAADNVLLGNSIGTNAAGTAAVGNRQAGVHIQFAHRNVVGVTTAGARNVIAGNGSGRN